MLATRVISEEDRIKGQETRRLKKEAGKLLNHNWDSGDLNYWRELARKYSVRLPQSHLPADITGIRKILRRYGKDSNWFKEWTGFSQTSEYVDRNPGQPLYVFAGTVLEQVEFESK